MDHTYFITGYPGFIASRLLDALIKNYPKSTFYLLILQKEKENAKKSSNSYHGNVHLIEGDITKSDLGITRSLRYKLTNTVTHCIHLAALYDLTVPFNPAYSCNVLGTEHVIQLVNECKHIKRFCYFSTAYVSGNETGEIFESRLIEPVSFRNYYEQTKFEAEKRVQTIMGKIPVTVIRPGIIVGDSSTGETIKFDGPYFMMQFLRRISFLPIPYIGKSTSFIHLVPVDFVIKATVYLLHNERSESKTYHLLCPNSPSVQNAYTMICQELNGKIPSWNMPINFAERLLSIPIIARWLGVPKEILSYFTHDAYYDTSQLEHDLEGSGLVFPQFVDFVKPVVRYYNENAENVRFKRY